MINVKHKVGAATLLSNNLGIYALGRWNKVTHLIHMLAKHETPINVRSTTLGLVPARLKTRVMRMRSMLVLLRADAIVKPPMRSMMVGENI